MALANWDRSSALAFTKATGDSSERARKRFVAITGKVRVCNAAYGNHGWLGLPAHYQDARDKETNEKTN